jgi:hypothetical protein
VWCDDPQEDPVISVFAGCLANHDRAHSRVEIRIDHQYTDDQWGSNTPCIKGIKTFVRVTPRCPQAIQEVCVIFKPYYLHPSRCAQLFRDSLQLLEYGG